MLRTVHKLIVWRRSFSKEDQFMTLVSAVEKLQKRALLPAEITALNDLQQLYKIDDDEP